MAAGAVVLGIGSTFALAAFGVSARPELAMRCDAPALTGTVVDVTLSDQGAMMGDMHRPGPPPWWRRGMGMVHIDTVPAEVPAGTVSLRASNVGAWTHEVLALPLPAGQGAGQRPAGSDGRIEEIGSRPLRGDDVDGTRCLRLGPDLRRQGRGVQGVAGPELDEQAPGTR